MKMGGFFIQKKYSFFVNCIYYKNQNHQLNQSKNEAFTSIFSFIITIFQVHSQENLPTDYLSKEFHKGRREAFRTMMPTNSVAVIFSYPERVFSRDINYNFHQNPDLYYLTGYKEPDAVLLIFKEAQGTGETYNEVFFVREKNAPGKYGQEDAWVLKEANLNWVFLPFSTEKILRISRSILKNSIK